MRFVRVLVGLMMIAILPACHYPPRPEYDPPAQVIESAQQAFDYLWKHNSATWRYAFEDFRRENPGWYLRLMTSREKDRLTPQTRCSRKQYMLVSEAEDRMWAIELCERDPPTEENKPVITRWPPPPIDPHRPAD